MALLGMGSIRKLGLSGFSSNYYWPISDEEFRVFVDSVLGELEAILVEVDQDITDLVIADYRFLSVIIQHIHYKGAWARFAESGTQSICDSSLAEMIYPSWDSHIQYFSESNILSGHFGNHRDKVKSRLRHRLRHLRNTARVNPAVSSLKLILPGYQAIDHLSIGPFTKFKQKFLAPRPEFIPVVEWDFFGVAPSSPDPTFLQRLRTQFLNPYFSTIEKQSRCLSAKIDTAKISETFAARLLKLNAFYSRYRNIKFPPKQIYLTGSGNPLRKTLATALQRLGTQVFVLHHGDETGLERSPHAHRNDGSFCNFYVCPTPQITKNYRDNYSSSLLEVHAGTQYVTSEGSHYQSLKQKYRGKSYAAGHKGEVMLIGFPMSHQRYLDGAGYFYYFQLDLQYRVAKLIKRLGYRLVYKVHPDRAVEVGDLFSSVADSLEFRPFEEVWDSADTYVFTIPGTTVFGQTVLTTKPMLLINLENNNWNIRGYASLTRRCQMVSSYFDSANRIVFDEMEFSEKLNNPLSLDDTYINEFLF